MEGFAIVGAINGSIGAINTVKSWINELRDYVRESRDAADKLQQFLDQYEMCEADLEIWRDMWGLEENASLKYQANLWGKRPRQAISVYLGSIYKAHEEIKVIFMTFLEESELFDEPELKKGQITGTYSSMSRKNLAENSKLKVKQNKKSLKGVKTIKFVSSQSPRLLNKIAFIQKQTLDMKSIAKTAFSNKHQIPISGDFLPKTTLDDANSQLLFQLAYEARLASRGLYQSCYAASKVAPKGNLVAINGIKLELDLLHRGIIEPKDVITREIIALQYQLLVAWPHRFVELSIEGPYDPEKDPSSYALGGVNFYDACMRALTNESGSFRVNSIDETKWFRSFVPPEGRRITKSGPQNPYSNEHRLKPLSTLLYDINSLISGEPADKFPRSERISLAFKVAECGLFLCGTSWLVGIRSQHIQRSRRDPVNGRRFLLDTQASNSDFNDAAFREFAGHAFAIGLLLTEIGTGRLVHSIPKRHKIQGQGFSLYTARSDPPSNPILFSGAEIHQRLVVAMGDDYANTVKVCLESKESWNEAQRHTAERRADVYEKALADYYSEIYLPLKALRSKIHWDIDIDET